MDQARKINYKPITTSKGFPKSSLKFPVEIQASWEYEMIFHG